MTRLLGRMWIAASMMSAAFGISADEAGTSLARWRQNLGLSQDAAMLLGDTVNLLGNTMATNEADILQVINRQGVVAQSAGLAANEIAALSATLLAAGASPEIAATGLKNFTNALGRGESVTKRQAAVFERLGIESVALAKRMQLDATGGILSVLEAFQQLDAHEVNAAVGDLFGEEAKGAIMPLISNVQMLEQAFAKTADTASLLGLMEEEYRRQAATTDAQRRRLIEYAKALSVVIGTGLLPAINELMASVMPLISAFGDFAAQHPRVIEGLAKGAFLLLGFKLASIVARLALIGLTTPLLQLVRVAGLAWVAMTKFGRVLLWVARGPLVGVLKAVRLVIGAFLRLGLMVLANPIGLILTAIVGLALAIYENWDKIAAYLQDKVDRVKAAFEDGLLNGVLAAIAEFNPFTLIIDGILGLLGWIWTLIGRFTELPGRILEAFAGFSLYDTGVAILQSLWDGMADLLPKIVAAISAKLSGIIPSWMKSAWNWVSGGDGDTPPGRDLGGPVRAGMPYLVGERAPEIFVPGSDGSILPTRALRSAMAAATIAAPTATLAMDPGSLASSFDHRPALASQMAAPQISRQGDSITINIHPAPGMSAEDIGREVQRQLARREADRRADLHDGVDYG